MYKIILPLFLCFFIKADQTHDIEIAILSTDVKKLGDLLRKVISPLEKKKYLSIAHSMTLKYATPMNEKKYKKVVHFAVGGIAIVMFGQQVIETLGEIGELDDLRRKVVIFGIIKAGVLLGFGTTKLYQTYTFYHKI